ncbi:kinase-like domain-containing protein [Scheffersomyces xylosifermentans]|uniref:kinase-like domain-containing protein n=1 Tax=Scheffersomyces xylosifermentans TaxID=1304137 RepID=UPI00315D67E5
MHSVSLSIENATSNPKEHFDALCNTLPLQTHAKFTPMGRRSFFPLDKQLLRHVSSFYSVVSENAPSDYSDLSHEVESGSYKSEYNLIEKYGFPQQYLGDGTYGTTYQFAMPNSKSYYAVKHMDKTVTPSLKTDMVLWEYHITRKLSSKFVAKSIDVLMNAQKPEMIIVQDYAKGVDLYIALFKERPSFFDVKYSERVTKKVIEALSHCHENGIFHNDIKPENIMLDYETNNVKLVDFGLAANLEARATPRRIEIVMSSGTDGLKDHKTSLKYPHCTSFHNDRTLHRMGMAKDMFALGNLAFYLLTSDWLWDYSNLNDDFYSDFVRSGHLRAMTAYLRKLKGEELQRVKFFVPILERMVDTNDGTRLTFPELIRSTWYNSIA